MHVNHALGGAHSRCGVTTVDVNIGKASHAAGINSVGVVIGEVVNSQTFDTG